MITLQGKPEDLFDIWSVFQGHVEGNEVYVETTGVRYHPTPHMSWPLLYLCYKKTNSTYNILIFSSH